MENYAVGKMNVSDQAANLEWSARHIVQWEQSKYIAWYHCCLKKDMLMYLYFYTYECIYTFYMYNGRMY